MVDSDPRMGFSIHKTSILVRDGALCLDHKASGGHEGNQASAKISVGAGLAVEPLELCSAN
jgi:hypothetical protein